MNDKRFIKKFDRSIPCRDSDLDDLEKRNEIRNFNFPVAISDLNPNLSMSLIRERDFEELNLEFPDSLHSIYSKYFDCTWWEQIRQDD